MKSWRTVLVSLLFVGLCVAGCLSINLRRPQTAEELRFSVDFTATVAHGVGYAWAWNRLDGREEVSDQAGEVLEVAEVLATAGVVFSSTDVIGYTVLKEPRYASPSESQYASLRKTVQVLSGQDWKDPDRKLLMSYVGYWLTCATTNLSDRAHLARFCTQGANGIKFAYQDRYIPKSPGGG